MTHGRVALVALVALAACSGTDDGAHAVFTITGLEPPKPASGLYYCAKTGIAYCELFDGCYTELGASEWPGCLATWMEECCGGQCDQDVSFTEERVDECAAAISEQACGWLYTGPYPAACAP